MMSEEMIEKIFETACDLCHWPLVMGEEELARKCDRCPMEKVLKEATEEADELKRKLRHEL